MTRVGVLLWKWGVGGAEVVAYFILKLLLDKGYNVEVFYISGEYRKEYYKNVVGADLPDNLVVRRIGSIAKLSLYRSLLTSIYVNRHDVDFVINTHGGLIPYMRRNETKCISYVHFMTLLRQWERVVSLSRIGLVSSAKNLLWNVYYKIYKSIAFREVVKSLKKCNKIIANSSVTSNILSRYVAEGSVTIVNPPVPRYQYYAQFRGENRDQGLILTISRISPEKELEKLIYMMKELKGNYRLAIVGSLSRHDLWYYNYLQGIINRLNLEKYIKFYINSGRDMKDVLIRSASVYVSPTTFESFGISIAEASIAGMPVVVSRASGFYRDVCGGDVEGCRGWERGEPGELAELVYKASRDGPLGLDRLEHLRPDRFMERFAGEALTL
ncbi:MAG: glycosyltransferase family 4 protein [Desulfurococcales archaeon]|nr:glycosyltransferase family 4 protein [Desulfurococcales archaeon]